MDEQERMRRLVRLADDPVDIPANLAARVAATALATPRAPQAAPSLLGPLTYLGARLAAGAALCAALMGITVRAQAPVPNAPSAAQARSAGASSTDSPAAAWLHWTEQVEDPSAAWLPGTLSGTASEGASESGAR